MCRQEFNLFLLDLSRGVRQETRLYADKLLQELPHALMRSWGNPGFTAKDEGTPLTNHLDGVDRPLADTP